MFNSVKACQKAIYKLQSLFFQIYIKRDYLQDTFFYEKKIHQQSQKILRALSRVNRAESYNQLTQLYDATLAMGQLRYRVKDYSTFIIIEQELKALAVASVKDFPEKIKALETICYNTLNVAAADPVLFLLFVDALKDMRKEHDV